MKEKFNSYYKPWFFASLVIVGMSSLSGILKADEPRYDRLAPIMLIGTLVLTVFCGGIYHFFYEYVKPRRVKKLIKRPRLNYLTKLGLEFDEDNYVYAGEIKSYYVTVAADTNAQTGDSIIINAFISPTEHQDEILTELQKKYELYFDEGLCWLTNRIGFLFNTPKQANFETELNQLIDDIRFNHIAATELEEDTDNKK